MHNYNNVKSKFLGKRWSVEMVVRFNDKIIAILLALENTLA